MGTGLPRKDTPEARAYWQRVDAAAEHVRQMQERVMNDTAQTKASNDPLTAVIAERDHERARVRQTEEELARAQLEVDRLIRERNAANEMAEAFDRQIEALREERDRAQEALDFLRAEIDKTTGSTGTFDRVDKIHKLRGERDTWKTRAEFEENAKKELATERNALTLKRDELKRDLDHESNVTATALQEIDRLKERNVALAREVNDMRASVAENGDEAERLGFIERSFGVDHAKGPDRAVVTKVNVVTGEALEKMLDNKGGLIKALQANAPKVRAALGLPEPDKQWAESQHDDGTEPDPSLGDIVEEAQGIDPEILEQLAEGIGPTVVGSPAQFTADFREAFEEGHAEAPAPTVLEEAAKIVDGPRRQHYGHPAENHGRTALYWNSYLGIDPFSPEAIDGHDVCQMNSLQKISRESGKGRKPRRQRDTLVDQCGYARNAEIIDLTEED